MKRKNTSQWLLQSNRRKRILCQFTQPLTPRQISKRTGLSLDTCSHLINELVLNNQIYCLNNDSRRSRLYWLTRQGHYNKKQIVAQGLVKPASNTSTDPATDLPPLPSKRPECSTPEGEILWKRYGWLCYNHRANVVLALSIPMSPSDIRRKAKQRNPRVRMNTNNVRDVLRLLLEKKIVARHTPSGQTRPLYELTPQGKAFQKLLQLAEVPAS